MGTPLLDQSGHAARKVRKARFRRGKKRFLRSAHADFPVHDIDASDKQL
jgi:hypothetical protein